MNRLQLHPCSMLGWSYCDGNCENCRTTASTTFTPYDPIEVARQYAPKFDKPVVDMVAVVRCKDCKWYEWGLTECHNPRYGDGWANYPPPQVYDEYFCKDGEREVEE